jgi:hypothetical protein
LYNGEKKLAYDVLKLSDAFKIKPSGETLELTVKILDVNHGSGCEALEKSESLDGYAYLVARIRAFQNEVHQRDKAIRLAIEECIEQGILTEYLKENFEGVIKMLSWEYDKDVEFDALREESEERSKAEAAFNMFKDGVSVDKVALYLNMPVNWVEGLRAEV